MKRSLTLLLLMHGCAAFTQVPCSENFRIDTTVINRFTYAREAVEMMEVTIKHDYQIQFIRNNDKTFLRIVARDNLGFGQIGEFVLICGKKQIYDKDVKLVTIDKSSGWFILELNPNYIQTIRDLGISRIIFRDTVEFVVPKSDSEKIRQTASCFFDAVVPK